VGIEQFLNNHYPRERALKIPQAVGFAYHDLVSAGIPHSGYSGRDADRYKLDSDLFAAHLHVIAASPGCLLTFDDGGKSALYIADRLDAEGLQGYFFIISDFIGTRSFLDESEIRELKGRGHIIGTHSKTHPPRMSHLPPATLAAEWCESCARLSDLLGEAVITASIPGGFYAPRVARAAAAAGITALFTLEPSHRVTQIATRDLPRLWTLSDHPHHIRPRN
jgi:peptidoglycan/xylan/chitin deacetylase (PgdA/CDA1 family)